MMKIEELLKLAGWHDGQIARAIMYAKQRPVSVGILAGDEVLFYAIAKTKINYGMFGKRLKGRQMVLFAILPAAGESIPAALRRQAGLNYYVAGSDGKKMGASPVIVPLIHQSFLKAIVDATIIKKTNLTEEDIAIMHAQVVAESIAE